MSLESKLLFISNETRTLTAEEALHRALIDYAYLTAGKLKFDQNTFEGNVIFPEERDIPELLKAVLEYSTNCKWRKDL